MHKKGPKQDKLSHDMSSAPSLLREQSTSTFKGISPKGNSVTGPAKLSLIRIIQAQGVQPARFAHRHLWYRIVSCDCGSTTGTVGHGYTN